MKIIIFAGFSKSLIHFRKELIEEMMHRGHEVIAIGPENDYKEELEKIGVRFRQIRFNRLSKNPINNMRLLLSLVSFMKSENADVYFGYTIKPVIFGTLAAVISHIPNRYAMITGAGSVFIDSRNNKFVYLLVKSLYKIALIFSNGVIFQNKDDLKQFCKLRLVSKGKCYLVNGSGVNLNYYKKRPMPKENIFLFIGSLLKNKGIKEYLEAAEKIKRKYPKSMFWIVGPLDQRISCINEKDLRDYVDRGIVDYFGEREDVRPYLEKCRIFVLPSYREGIPRSVLEAMSVGRAIITTDVPGCKETVQSYRNGILVPAKNNGALAEAMKWMIEHPEIVEMMGDLSFKLAKKRYDVNKVNKEMINIMKL